MKRLLLLASLCVTFYLLGCPEAEYTLNLRPTDTGLARELTVSYHNGARADEMAESMATSMAAMYGTTTTSGRAPTTQTYFRVFPDTMPNDVGGAGLYLTYKTSLGSAFIYIERFRGSLDVADQVEARLKAAEELNDLLVGWFATELGKDPAWPKLREWMKTDVRRDMRNLAVYAFAGSVTSGENALGDWLARTGEFLWERGYIHKEDMNQVGRMQDLGLSFLWIARARVSERLASFRGPGAAGGEVTPPFLMTLDGFAGSMTRYVAAAPAYRDRVAEAVRRRMTETQAAARVQTAQSQPTREELEGFGVEKIITPLMQGLMPTSFSRNDDPLRVVLQVTAEPTATNGKFYGTGKICWDTVVEVRSEMGGMNYPVMCYAIVVQPDEVFQVKHFGRVVFGGGDLVKYGVWHKALSQVEAAAWDKMIEGLSPGQPGLEAVERFKFPSGQRQPTTWPAGDVIKAMEAMTQPAK
jgi:hypothetical protein